MLLAQALLLFAHPPHVFLSRDRTRVQIPLPGRPPAKSQPEDDADDGEHGDADRDDFQQLQDQGGSGYLHQVAEIRRVLGPHAGGGAGFGGPALRAGELIGI